MNVRIFPVIIYAIAFILAFISLASVPSSVLKVMPDWYWIAWLFNLSVSFSGVLVAYWVYEDGKRIEDMSSYYVSKIVQLEDQQKKKDKSPLTDEELL